MKPAKEWAAENPGSCEHGQEPCNRYGECELYYIQAIQIDAMREAAKIATLTFTGAGASARINDRIKEIEERKNEPIRD